MNKIQKTDIQKDYKTVILKNGLVINHVKSKFPGIFRIELIIRAGALDEKKEEIGFAHFIEHLMSFFPSKKNPNGKTNQKELTKRSININAWTEPNTVGYYMSGLDIYTDFMIDMMLENYINPVLDETMFEQEKNAVASELTTLINDGDYPITQVIDFIRFRNTNLSYTVDYEKENVVENATIGNILNFRNRLYGRDYTSIIITSNFTEGKVDKLIDTIIDFVHTNDTRNPKNYGKSTKKSLLKYGNELKTIPTTGIFYVTDGEKNKIGNKSEAKLQIAFPLEFDYFDDRIFHLSLLETILSNGLGSRLFNKLRTQLGAVYHVGSDSHYDPRCKNMSSIIIETSTTKDKLLEVYDCIINEISKLTSEFITDDEIKHYCGYIEMWHIYEKQTLNDTSMLDYYKPYLLWGKTPRSLEYIYKLKKGLTKKELQKTAKEIFDFTKMSVFYTCEDNVLIQTNNIFGNHYEIPFETIKYYSHE